MSGTLQIARLFGIEIKLHFSWIFIFLLIAWSLAGSYLPQNYPGWSTNRYWVVGILGSISLFACVLVHELSHSLTAMSRGYRVSGITLFFLGGVSEIDEEATGAGEEFWIAVVGPLASLALAAIFGLFLVLGVGTNSPVGALVQYLAFINLVLALFNLIPAFPLDGGRVLKSLVWKATGSINTANAVASITGSILGFIFIGLGILIAFKTGSFISGLWLVFIGWFIQSTASSSRREQAVHHALSGRRVADTMDQDLPRVEPGTTVQDLLDRFITREFQRAYLVYLGDSFQGLVSVSDVIKVSPPDRSTRYVAEIMTRASEVASISPSDPLEAALQLLATRDVNQLVVMENGVPLGLLTRRDVLRVMEISQILGNPQGSP
jgi:Zn-dependent protease